MHPVALLTKNKLIKLGISEERTENWQELKDKLPNLQLMEGTENESKNKTPLKEWLSSEGKGEQYLRDNYFPDKIDLDIKHFEEFYEERKNILRKEIKKILK